ncbi:MAG: zinc-dependent alcohol dehydrogenase family protein [Chthonomonadales bacterium]
MRALCIRSQGPVEQRPLVMDERPIPSPGEGEVLIRVETCGVCRTDLHIVEGDLPAQKLPITPGHEVIGYVAACGPATKRFRPGSRVGVAWLHRSCGRCRFCTHGRENLCEHPTFTGWHVDGGYAEYMVAPEDFVYPIPQSLDAVETAPLLCAGIIGYRAFRMSEAGRGETLGLYGFGASAHIVLQIALHAGCRVFAVTREPSRQQLARDLGAEWAGGLDERPPVPLRSAILFAPVGALVPVALEALDRGGTLAIADISMTPVPALDYERHLFYERKVVSVTANTREDGRSLLELAAEIPIRTHVEPFDLEQAQDALIAMKEGRLRGAAAVLRASAS